VNSLNLTAANRIFIVEPQWNPSVENQAIARAIRLRQDKEVAVTKYVIKDTVEEVREIELCRPRTIRPRARFRGPYVDSQQEMRSQQVRKRLVASFGFDREPAEETGPGSSTNAAPIGRRDQTENYVEVISDNLTPKSTEAQVDLTGLGSDTFGDTDSDMEDV
jgi:hypothetical protein